MLQCFKFLFYEESLNLKSIVSLIFTNRGERSVLVAEQNSGENGRTGSPAFMDSCVMFLELNFSYLRFPRIVKKHFFNKPRFHRHAMKRGH